MKAILEFDLTEPYDKEEMNNALKGSRYKEMIGEIWERCFRPNFKHGYNDPELDTEEAYKVIDKISEIYQEVVRDLEE